VAGGWSTGNPIARIRSRYEKRRNPSVQGDDPAFRIGVEPHVFDPLHPGGGVEVVEKSNDRLERAAAGDVRTEDREVGLLAECPFAARSRELPGGRRGHHRGSEGRHARIAKPRGVGQTREPPSQIAVHRFQLRPEGSIHDRRESPIQLRSLRALAPHRQQHVLIGRDPGLDRAPQPAEPTGTDHPSDHARAGEEHPHRRDGHDATGATVQGSPPSSSGTGPAPGSSTVVLMMKPKG